jgi:catechol 2,3-dioxygenase-like lactoylglutathione lyase family enzyme
MILSLDHLVLLTRDLAAGVANYEALFARAPAWRTRADGVETALFTLENTTLEVLAPSGSGALAERVRAALDAGGEGLASLSFRVSDIAGMHRRLARLGLEPEEVAFHESVDVGANAKLAWKRTRAQANTHGARLFFLELEHARPLSPETGAAPAFAMDHVVIQTPAPERAAALYGARLGLDMALDRSNEAWGSRLMFFRCGDMIVEIAHSLKAGAGDGPDKLWGATWRVANADAAQARIAQAGFDVSEVRAGRKPGTKVFTVRNRTCSVPTLMLQPSPARDA